MDEIEEQPAQPVTFSNVFKISVTMLVCLHILIGGLGFILIFTRGFRFLSPSELQILNYADLICFDLLACLFAWYCLRKNYRAVFFATGILFVLHLFEISGLFHETNFVNDPIIGFGATFTVSLLLMIAHALTILFSVARTNRWLRIYGILSFVCYVFIGNLMSLNYFILAMIVGFLILVSPVCFILMVQNESKSRFASNSDVLDNSDHSI